MLSIMSETRTVYQRHISKLNLFHMTCRCKLLHIGWCEMIPDTEVLRCTGLPSIDTMLSKPCCAGRDTSSAWERNTCPSNCCMASSVKERDLGVNRSVTKRYKDTLKILNKWQVDPDTWEDLAANHLEWHSRVAEGAVDYQEDHLTTAKNKRRIRKTVSVSSVVIILLDQRTNKLH